MCSENGHFEGSIQGMPTSTGTEKLWLVAQALGDIAFSYPFSVILIEIQVCMHDPLILDINNATSSPLP
jgi:hypothetical protein